MPYRIAGIDVHKKRLAVVVADVESSDEFQFERRWYGSNPEQLRALSEWLIEQQVEEAVMESTAQYWKPVWGALERYWRPICQRQAGCLEHYIWHKRCPIEVGVGAKQISEMPNDW
jgi:hypothetical protein